MIEELTVTAPGAVQGLWPCMGHPQQAGQGIPAAHIIQVVCLFQSLHGPTEASHGARARVAIGISCLCEVCEPCGAGCG